MENGFSAFFNYSRRQTHEVQVGGTPLGGDNPIRVQSMTTTPTTDTEACVEQAERIIKAGGEYVRLTTQGVREAENLKNINARLREDGYMTPLVADVHFNPHVADVAALYAEKVRINPGNYVDPARTFKKLEYTDEEYAEELKKIEKQFVPFLNICKENHTAVRIGVNHGSLSDRIMSRYGDTPAGIVESCMEFLRICKREKFDNVVISIKASNTVVMVQSVRLLVEAMNKEEMDYPLHLGVTEAGEGEDGRIKSAVGIGALLCDGIGDTIRVSLSEEPEAEIPVARHLVDYITRRTAHMPIPGNSFEGFNWASPERRKTKAVGGIGGGNLPVVISSRIAAGANGNGQALQKETSGDATLQPDFLYVGTEMPAEVLPEQKYIVDFDRYARLEGDKTNIYPIFPYNAVPFISGVKADLKFLVLPYGAASEEYIPCLKAHPEVVVVSMSNHQNKLGEQRALLHEFMNEGIENPVVFCQMYSHSQEEKGDFQLEAAADMGALMFDGFTDGIWLMNNGTLSDDVIDATAFGILQAARLRTTKTEYISCPGCGRTLYDLRTTIARIKEATKDMKGLKIGIMGCIVNGPGEMADADYGYVGAGRGKISLYRRKECVEKNIPEEEAVEKLLQLIRSDER
ncbi:4-hydroxy-3-methylbut-2-en-1-yl diphosphate synthase [uncultured Prevotella sp.]|uniref:4-hydroxy-3-methylbut-2-en-1-yl diphosphate synthase n=1 Tax=uncultured Prevotella sp. TaxID=159272 RepID=UPI0026030827|nr:4-hydroxy-3-methylbut-2-en-1-yl diphosphate synthase [uncultured Prevotella sp.]